MRRCSKTACLLPAVATLTYVYADSTAVLGPLAATAVPGALDLCAEHAQRTSVPRGWEVIRLPMAERPSFTGYNDDLLKLADAVREIGLRHDEVEPVASKTSAEPEPMRQAGHLRLLPSNDR